MAEIDVTPAAHDWDERARNNAFCYICSERADWDPASFFLSGEDDYHQLVSSRLAALEFDPRGKTMLEIGCGVGRVTRSFARRFAKVYALDVSREMLQRAQALNPDCDNVVWLQGEGERLSQLGADSVDFAFSYLTLQHMPSARQALGCIREILRVLKPGGVYCFQFNSNSRATMNWKGRLIWTVLDRLQQPVWGLNLQSVGVRVASLFGLDFLQGGRTWHGAALDPRDVLENVWQAGGTVQGLAGWGTARTWCYGHKTGTRTPQC